MQPHPILGRQSRATPGVYMSHTQNYKNLDPKVLGYNSIGDPYRDPAKSSKIPSRFGGKQFLTNPPKDPSGDIGHFDKIKYVGAPYWDRTRYIDTQPVDKRKHGFNSRDAARRDEFSTHIRTEQYREQLKCELSVANRLSKDGVKDEVQQKAGKIPAKGFPSGLRETKHLFDIGRSQETAFDPRSSRDTFYNALMCHSRERGERRTGGAYLSSQEVGDGIAGLDHGAWKPKHGLRHATKAFYDKSHVGESPLQ